MIVVGGYRREGLQGVDDLVCVCQERQGGAAVTRRGAECCYASTFGVGQELEVVEGAPAAGKAAEDLLPAGLLFVATRFQLDSLLQGNISGGGLTVRIVCVCASRACPPQEVLSARG